MWLGPCLSVRLREVSAYRRCPLVEVRLYILCNNTLSRSSKTHSKYQVLGDLKGDVQHHEGAGVTQVSSDEKIANKELLLIDPRKKNEKTSG